MSPNGSHLNTCLCCRKEWISGCVIADVCDDCAAKGHTGALCKKCYQVCLPEPNPKFANWTDEQLAEALKEAVLREERKKSSGTQK